MNELKPCPFRVHGERTASLTISGEFYYNEIFMPCLREDCPAFIPQSNICTLYGANYDLNLNRRADNG